MNVCTYVGGYTASTPVQVQPRVGRRRVGALAATTVVYAGGYHTVAKQLNGSV